MGRGFRGTRRTTISVVGQLSSVLAILVAAVAFIVAGPAAARDLPVHAALASSHGPRSHGQPRQVASTVVQHALPTFEPGPGETYVGVSSTETGPSYSGFLHSTGLRHVAIWDLFTSPNQDFGGILSHIRTVGDTAMLTWDFPGNGTLESIADGSYDGYIRRVANEARRYGRPLFIRLDWEFNGHWYPWSAETQGGKTRPGNSPTEYVAAWRRTVKLFRTAPNVTFVWCPTMYEVNHPQRYPLSAWYPGNAYVGWVGIDAYLASASWKFMQHGPDALDAEYTFAASRDKPVMVSEWALSDPGSGDSTVLVSKFWRWMHEHPLVKAQLWFNFDQTGGTRYEISSFPRSAELLRTYFHEAGADITGP